MASAVRDEVGAAEAVLNKMGLDAVLQCTLRLFQRVRNAVSLAALRAMQVLNLAVGFPGALHECSSPVPTGGVAGRQCT